MGDWIKCTIECCVGCFKIFAESIRCCCDMIEALCRWCCEEIEILKNSKSNPQANQILEKQRKMFYACLFGVATVLQQILVISLIITMVQGLQISFYLISPNIILLTILVLVIAFISTWNNYLNFSKYFSMQIIHSLRGGGITCSCQNQVVIPTQLTCNQNIFEMFPKFNHYIQIIEQKASFVANQQESSEVMIAIQWFSLQEENIYNLNKNIQSVQKSYDLIIEGIKRVFNSCLIYIKTDSFICLYILQITTSLSKVIFSFHLMNKKRFMELEDQKQFLEICEELKLQIEIEKNDFVQNQIELFLFLTQIAFEIAPNNSNEKQEILAGCLGGIIKSVIKMNPDIELIESLFQWAKLLYQEYHNYQQRKQYEIYYQICYNGKQQFINNLCGGLEQIILQLQMYHETIVKGSINWIDHYLWIQMIGRILLYNPIIKKQQLSQVISAMNLGQYSIRQIWDDYKTKGLLIQLNYSNDTSVIVINQLKNQQTLELDRLISEYYFQGWENFLLFKNTQWMINRRFPLLLEPIQNQSQIQQIIMKIQKQQLKIYRSFQVLSYQINYLPQSDKISKNLMM